MANRANHRVLLGWRLVVRRSIAVRREYCRGADPRLALPQVRQCQILRPLQVSRSPPMPAWPVTPSRPASSSISTSRSSFAPSRLPIPIAWSSTFPRSTFKLAAGTGCSGAGAGQGVPLWARDARRFADRVRSDGTGQDRQILCAGGGQRPAAAAGARTGRGRPHRLRAVAGAGKPARAAAGESRKPMRLSCRHDAGQSYPNHCRRQPIRGP